jgi:hypothetical protein
LIAAAVAVRARNARATNQKKNDQDIRQLESENRSAHELHPRFKLCGCIRGSRTLNIRQSHALVFLIPSLPSYAIKVTQHTVELHLTWSTVVGQQATSNNKQIPRRTACLLVQFTLFSFSLWNYTIALP